MPATQAPPDESLTPTHLLERIAELAAEHFLQPPDLLTTDRTGRFECGWRKDAEIGWVTVPARDLRTGHRQYLRARLHILIAQYVQHPGADYRLLTRNAAFPQSVELLIPPGDH